MKLKHLILAIGVSVLIGTEARAGYGFEAMPNSDLYKSTLTYLKNLQTEFFGEPAYYMIQGLMMEIEASYPNNQYAWIGQVSRFCNMMENIYPPSLGSPMARSEERYDKLRRAILLLRDYPMHVPSISGDGPPASQVNAFNTANAQWLQFKRDEFFQFLSSSRPSGSEIQVAKLYSSGVVLRTKEACIGIDICYEEGLYSPDRREELADHLDVVYVTHAHGDHYDVPLLQMMLQKGKSVVAPHTMGRHFVSTYPDKLFLWSEDQATAVNVQGKAQTKAFMSAQGDEPCLLYHILLGNWRIIHVGDNSHHENETPYTKEQIADLVFAPVFQGLTSLFKNTRGAPNPDNAEQVYVNIHENEWHHTIDGRVPYKYLFDDSGALGGSGVYPSYAFLDNGEHITLSK